MRQLRLGFTNKMSARQLLGSRFFQLKVQSVNSHKHEHKRPNKDTCFAE